MSGEGEDDMGTALPRRIRHQIGGRHVAANNEIADQVARYNELCGPVTVIRKDPDDDSSLEQ